MVDNGETQIMSIRIAINGFGRIGRQLARIVLSEPEKGLKLVAINTLEDCAAAAHLLKYDSIQGMATAHISAIAGGLCVNGAQIPVYHESSPDAIPWRQDNIDIVIECSGHFTRGNKAALHLKNGVKRVVITAAAEADITICIGVNQHNYEPARHKIISGSSCTANCLAPLVGIINDTWGIKAGFATFIHSSTNSQHLLDTVDSDLRRARSATLNLIPCKTSAARQIPLVIPQLHNKFDAMAVRVPTPAVHLADFTALLRRNPASTDILAVLEKAARGRLRGIMRLSHTPLVSIDYRNSRHSCVIDAGRLIVRDNMLKIMVWHANEFSYCQRIIDLISFIGAT